MAIRVAVKWMVILVSLKVQVSTAVNLEERCGEEVVVSDAVKLNIGNWTELSTRSTCTVNLTAVRSDWPDQESPNQLMFLVQRLSFPDEDGACTRIRLDIWDVNNETLLTPAGGLCGGRDESDQFVSTARRAAVVLTLNDTTNVTAKDVSLRLLAVRFHINPCEDDEEFECDNDRCVATDLQCNDDNDCGDGSDEKDGCIMSDTVYIIIGVCTGGLVIAVLWAAVKLYRGKTGGQATWWGEPRLIVGASAINEDSEHERRRLAGGKRKSDRYGAT